MGARAGHEDWDEQYSRAAPPPWEIGGPQPALAALIERIPVISPVLDAGCGTGDLAGALAARGHQVVGVDRSQRALAEARTKSADVDFVQADAEHLDDLDMRPRTVFDSGLLHNLDDEGQAAYVTGLAAICVGGATVHVLAVSHEAGDGWTLTRDGLSRLFAPPYWVGTDIRTADVLATVDGEELHLPAFLLSTRRAD